MTPRLTKRIFLINRDFQVRYAKTALLVGLASTILTFFLVLFPLYHFGIVRFPGFLPVPFIIGIALACVVNFAIVATGAILLTHRVVGPMFSLVRQMRVLQSGTWNAPLRVRETDELKYVVRNFNELVDYLLESLRGDLSRVGQARRALGTGDANAAASVLAELEQSLEARLAAPPAPSGGGAP